MGLVFDLGSWLTRQSYATPDSSALQPDPVRAGGSQPCHSLTSISVTATLFGQHTDTLASTFYLILSKVTMGGIVSSSAYWHHTIFSDHESYASKRWECIQNRQYRINHAFRLKKKKSYTWVFFSCKYRQMNGEYDIWHDHGALMAIKYYWVSFSLLVACLFTLRASFMKGRNRTVFFHL